ncbi:MAG TPA: sulfotransferase [Saprospiraceae bacterium]|nr:sulfotransferase [Saprospiraceae bacterium]HMQ84677.1 sulfotransferase [Saprospiraceae bacterium]
MQFPENNIHFIVGMSRAGTNWLMLSLNNHTRVVSFGETSFWGSFFLNKAEYDTNDLILLKEKYKNLGYSTPHLFKQYGGTGQVIGNVLDILIETGKEYAPKDVFLELASAFASLENKPIVIEKTPHHVNHLARIRQNFPNSKVIIHKREAKAFMLSYKHQGDRMEDKIKRKFKKLYHPLGCALVYKKYLRSIKLANKLENTLLIDTYEIDIEPDEVLKKVLSFIEVPFENISLPKANSSFSGDFQKSLAVDDLFWLWMVVEGQKLDLKASQLFLLPFIVLFSTFKIPFWILFTISHMSKHAADKKSVSKYLYNLLK